MYSESSVQNTLKRVEKLLHRRSGVLDVQLGESVIKGEPAIHVLVNGSESRRKIPARVDGIPIRLIKVKSDGKLNS